MTDMIRPTARGYGIAAALVVATFLAFYPILGAGFTNWDDPAMVTQNPAITGLSWSHWVGFFTTLVEKHYHPLVMVSYAVDYRLAGLSAFTFHLTSLAIHLASTALVFWLFTVLSENVRVGFVTAALFGWHPMHVESVAWISERKDVLYSLFFWAALLAHTYYVRRQQRSLYWLGLGLFVLSLLSKSMAVTLPAVLLLIDWLLGRKLGRSAILEKLPHVALSLGFAAIAVVGHSTPGAAGGSGSSAVSWLGHTQAAFENLLFYAIKFFAPVNLAALYPRPRNMGDFPAWLFPWSPLFLALLAALAYRFVRDSKPAKFGLLFFFVTLFPVSQILPIGLSIPADRYTYVPYVGLFFGLMSLIETAVAKSGKALPRQVVGALLTVVLALSWWATRQRVKIWHDTTSLWTDSLAKYPVARAYFNLGSEYLLAKKDPTRALTLFSSAIEANPKLSVAWLNRGIIYATQGDYPQSIANYNEAERLSPRNPDVYLNRGNTYSAIGMPARAVKDYTTALEIRAAYPEAWFNRGNVYLATGQWNRAIADFTKALTLGESFSVRINRGNAHWSAGNLSQAFDDFTVAIRLQPGSPNAYLARARIYAKYRQPAAAVSDALKARSLGLDVSEELLAELRR